jgi:hypothetical protein
VVRLNILKKLYGKHIDLFRYSNNKLICLGNSRVLQVPDFSGLNVFMPDKSIFGNKPGNQKQRMVRFFYIQSQLSGLLTGIIIFGRWKQKYKIRDFIALFSGQRKNSCRAGV